MRRIQIVEADAAAIAAAVESATLTRTVCAKYLMLVLEIRRREIDSWPREVSLRSGRRCRRRRGSWNGCGCSFRVRSPRRA